MAQCEFSNGVDIRFADCLCTAPCRVRPSGAQPHQIRAQSIDAGSEATLSDLRQCGVVQRDVGQCTSRIFATLAQGLLLSFPLRAKPLRIAVEIQPTPNDLPALGRRGVAAEGDVQTETVEQLWTQLALFRVHRADQHKPRRVAMGNAVALDQVGAAGGDVEEQIDEVIGQQIDLIDIKHTAVGLGQNAGRELRAAIAEGRVEVEGADQAFLGGAQRQGDELAAGEQIGEATGQGRLGHTARAFDEHAADFRVDGGEAQGEFQVIGADHGGEGEMRGVGHLHYSVMVGEMLSNCGSGLAREGGVSFNALVSDTTLSRASPLPHLEWVVSGVFFYVQQQILQRLFISPRLLPHPALLRL